MANPFQETDGSLEALRGLWGERAPPKRSYLTPDRTELLNALAGIHEAMQAMPERFRVHGVKEYHDHLLDCWAGEDGRDMEWMIRAVGAAKAQVSVQQQAQPQAKREEKE
jgi:hypothetical protein